MKVLGARASTVSALSLEPMLVPYRRHPLIVIVGLNDHLTVSDLAIKMG